MKLKKYQFETSFLSKDATFAQNNFIFHEVDKLACWVMIDAPEGGAEPVNYGPVLKEIVAEFMQKPSFSEFGLREFLTRTRKRFGNHEFNQPMKPHLLMMVTDYSRMVWAVNGDLRLYLVRKGRLKFASSNYQLLDYLLMTPNAKKISSNTYFLQDNDLFLLCNTRMAECIQSAEFNWGAAGLHSVMEQAETIQERLSNENGAADLRMVLIAAQRQRKRSLAHDVKELKKTEVLMPVVLMACLGMLAIYEIETQKLQHALAITKLFALLQQQNGKPVHAVLPLKKEKLIAKTEISEQPEQSEHPGQPEPSEPPEPPEQPGQPLHSFETQTENLLKDVLHEAKQPAKRLLKAAAQIPAKLEQAVAPGSSKPKSKVSDVKSPEVQPTNPVKPEQSDSLVSRPENQVSELPKASEEQYRFRERVEEKSPLETEGVQPAGYDIPVFDPESKSGDHSSFDSVDPDLPSDFDAETGTPDETDHNPTSNSINSISVSPEHFSATAKKNNGPEKNSPTQPQVVFKPEKTAGTAGMIQSEDSQGGRQETIPDSDSGGVSGEMH